MNNSCKTREATNETKPFRTNPKTFGNIIVGGRKRGEKNYNIYVFHSCFTMSSLLWHFTDNIHTHTRTYVCSTAIKTTSIRAHNTNACSHCTKRDFFWKTTNRGGFNRFEFIIHSCLVLCSFRRLYLLPSILACANLFLTRSAYDQSFSASGRNQQPSA